MMEVRRSDTRLTAELSWMKTHHSFSFADYHNLQHLGFGPLRVINEQHLFAEQSSGIHDNRETEIIVYPLGGVLGHQDNIGNSAVLRYGDVHRLSAGTGVRYTDFSHSRFETAHYLQIWIEPSVRKVAPSYQKGHFDVESKRGQLRLIASSDGRDSSVLIHQDVAIYASILNKPDLITHKLRPGRTAYVHIATGQLLVNGITLNSGDALLVTGSSRIVTLSQADAAEVLLFDLPY